MAALTASPRVGGWRVILRALALVFVFAAMTIAPARADRVKDLAQVAGVRGNALIGYGLVVGLDGTGDQVAQTPFTIQSLENMLTQFGITLPDNVNPQTANIAAVTVHAELPAFAKPGTKIDVTVASIGNAGSIRGGSLLLTPLKGVDGQVYALAQGNLVVGGFGASGLDGSSVTVNIPSAGRIPGGATVERASPAGLPSDQPILLNLNTPDFTTATRLAEVINVELGGDNVAAAIDAVSIAVAAPSDPAQRTAFIAVLENFEVKPGDAPARVIVNSRTGTVVIGSHVAVTPAAVAHGSLVVTISEDPIVSQPGAFGAGDTAVVADSEVSITEDGSRMFLFEPGTKLDDIVQAVNQVGAAPGDLVAILEALRQAGALRAELIVI